MLCLCAEFLDIPGIGYIISSIVVVGMLIGAVVKHAGWGIKDVSMWVVVGISYAIGVQAVEQKAGFHIGVDYWDVLGVMLFVFFFYQIGVAAGMMIVKHERAKTRPERRKWEGMLLTVNGGDKDPATRPRPE